MAAGSQIPSPFLQTPASFERLDNPDQKGEFKSAFESTTTTQEINSWWNEYLTPTAEKSTSVTNETSPEVREPSLLEIGGVKEINFSEKNTVIKQAVIAEGMVEINSEQSNNTVAQSKGSGISINLEAPLTSTITTTVEAGKKVGKVSVKTSKDIKTAMVDLFKNYIFFKVEKKDEKKGEKKDEKKKTPPPPFFARPVMTDAQREQRAKQVEDINRKLKSNNLSFEGVLNPDGSIRADVQANLDRINSELQEAEIKRKKESTMQTAMGASKKGSRGPRVSTNLNLSAEDPNNITKLLG